MPEPRVRNLKKELLSDNWYKLYKLTYQYLRGDEVWETQQREAYDRGNGAVILLYNQSKQTVILTRQLRIPSYINGNEDGMMIEACAGLLDDEDPEETIRRETLEETGYQVNQVVKVFEAYMSPGSVTEILHFFIAEYANEMKIGQGGGAEDEHEDIEVLELGFPEALQMVERGIIKDAKTIMLLQYLQIRGLLS